MSDVANIAPYNGGLLDTSTIASLPQDVAIAEIRKHCYSVYLGDSTALCRVLGRYKMFVDTRDIGFANHLLMDGSWEFNLTQFIVQRVSRGMRVADIGANFGYYSILMSGLVGDDGFCHSFEPNPAAAKLLRQSLDVNGFDWRSKVHQVAVSSETGSSPQFWVPLRRAEERVHSRSCERAF